MESIPFIQAFFRDAFCGHSREPGIRETRKKNLFTGCEEGQVRQRRDGFWYKNCEPFAEAGWKDLEQAKASIFESKLPILGTGKGRYPDKGFVWEPRWVGMSDEITKNWTKKGDVARGGENGRGLGAGHRRFLGMSVKWLINKRGYVVSQIPVVDGNFNIDLIKLRNKKYCLSKAGTKAKPYRGAYYDNEPGVGWVFGGESANWSPKQKIRHAKRAARACTVVNPSLKASYPKYSKWADKNKAAMKKCTDRGGTWDKKGRKCVGKKVDQPVGPPGGPEDTKRHFEKVNKLGAKDPDIKSFQLILNDSDPSVDAAQRVLQNDPKKLQKFRDLIAKGVIRYTKAWTGTQGAGASVRRILQLPPSGLPPIEN